MLFCAALCWVHACVRAYCGVFLRLAHVEYFAACGWLARLLCKAHRQGVEFVEIGTSHRGRLNILHNIMDQSMASICRELDKKTQAVAGDLQIHIGTTAELQMGCADCDADIYEHLPSAHRAAEDDTPKPLSADDCLRVSMSPNPAHLEAVNPVVLGTKIPPTRNYIQRMAH